MKVINKIVPSTEIRIKNNNQDWCDREAADLIHVREKLFLKFKKSKLCIDEEIYKKNSKQVQNLIKKKKRDFLGLSSKVASESKICLKDKNEIVFDDTKNCSIFKSFFFQP